MTSRSAKLGFRFGRITLRARLTLWTIVIYTLVFWVFGGVFWLYDSNAIRRVFSQSLDAQVRTIAESAVAELPGLERERLQQIVYEGIDSDRIGYFLADVFDAKGRHVIAGSQPVVDPASLPIDELLDIQPQSNPTVDRTLAVHSPAWTVAAGRSELNASVRSVIVGVTHGNGERYVVFLAVHDFFVEARLHELRNMLLVLLGVTPFLSALGGWFVAGIAVAPFTELKAMAGELRAETLGDELEIESSSPEVSALTHELDEARRDIRSAFQAQERFLSNISHEIKTPIAVMRVEAQTLDLSDSPEPVRDFVDSVQQEMKRLGNLVESFLTLTRIEDGHGQVRGKRYAVNDLVMDSVEQCAMMANQRNVWLRPGLFADDETLHTEVAGDPELLTTMLGNLIRNAITHSPAGSGVVVELQLEGTAVRIRVIDEGPGIPPERIEAVFDRFAQAAGSDRKGRGHGLGLAIARGIAELHQGTIRVRSEPGEGCEFEVTLPVAPG